MRKYIALAVVAAILGVGDIAAKAWAEQRGAKQIKAEVAAKDVSASITSFPFVGRLLIAGSVPSLRAVMHLVDAGAVTVDTVTIELHGVRLDRSQLLSERRVVVRGIDRGRVDVVFSGEQLSRALEVPVKLRPGAASVTVAGSTVPATIESVEGRLVLRAAGLGSVDVRFVEPRLLPCLPVVVIEQDRLVLGCDFTDMPAALLDEAR